MKTRGIRRSLVIALAAFAPVCGCTFRAVHLGPAEEVLYDDSRGRDVSGQACGFMLGGFIPIGMSDRDERAYGVLKIQARGDYIGQVGAEQQMTYAFVGWSICTTFRGKAYPRF
jgi:hypothetical protein